MEEKTNTYGHEVTIQCSLLSLSSRGQEEGFPTFFFHASPEAFVESAETTLVPFIFIHDALPAEPAFDEHTMI